MKHGCKVHSQFCAVKIKLASGITFHPGTFCNIIPIHFSTKIDLITGMTLLRRTPGRTYRWDALYEQSRCHYQCWLAELPALWRLIRQTQYCISTPSFNSHPSTHKLLSEPICPSPTPRPPARPRSPIAQRASKQAAAPSSSTRARIEKAILYSFSPL